MTSEEASEKSVSSIVLKSTARARSVFIVFPSHPLRAASCCLACGTPVLSKQRERKLMPPLSMREDIINTAGVEFFPCNARSTMLLSLNLIQVDNFSKISCKYNVITHVSYRRFLRLRKPVQIGGQTHQHFGKKENKKKVLHVSEGFTRTSLISTSDFFVRSQ